MLRHLPRAPTLALAPVLVLGASLVAGCGAPIHRADPPISLSSAQVILPSSERVTDVYVDVINNGPADEIIGASISVGGQVTLRAPVHPGIPQMQTVGSIAVPADSALGLDPNGSHLLVNAAGPMIAGREITLTLVFAHAGKISAPALVTDPESGGASYFLN